MRFPNIASGESVGFGSGTTGKIKLRGAVGGLFLLGAVATSLALKFFVECTQPIICRLLDAYTYEVKTLADYREYLAGRDLYAIHQASALSFRYDSLRDQLTAELHEAMITDPIVKTALGSSSKVREEVIRLGLLGARRDGCILHMMNDVTVGEEGLKVWEATVRSLIEKEPRDRKKEWLAIAMRELFDRVTLHAGDKQVSIHINKSRPGCK